jgi:hypothetical protein
MASLNTIEVPEKDLPLRDELLWPVRNSLPAWPTILDVIGHLLADGCQVEKFLLDEGIFGLLGKLPIYSRLLPKIVIPVHDLSASAERGQVH